MGATSRHSFVALYLLGNFLCIHPFLNHDFMIHHFTHRAVFLSEGVEGVVSECGDFIFTKALNDYAPYDGYWMPQII